MLDSFFRKNAWESRTVSPQHQLLVDVHAHILPNLDDGAESLDHSMTLLKEMSLLGYRKVIATPHVMHGYYNNSTTTIRQTLIMTRNALVENEIPIEIEAAAEYYLDDELLHKIEQGIPLLTLHPTKKYLLFETSFVSNIPYLLNAVLIIKKGGYIPVLAHPERYLYLQKDFENLLSLLNNGVLFQLNINSLTGYYSKPARILAELLITQKMLAFVGTDCHNEIHLEKLYLARKLPHYQLLTTHNLLNNSLMEVEIMRA